MDLFQIGELRTQAAVHADDFFVDDGAHRQAVEAVREGLPELDVVAALACIGENLHSS